MVSMRLPLAPFLFVAAAAAMCLSSLPGGGGVATGGALTGSQLNLAAALLHQQQQQQAAYATTLGLGTQPFNPLAGAAFEGLPIYLVPGATSLPSIPKVLNNSV
jgi:hypothetical protein